MKITGETKLYAGIIVGTILLIVGAVFFFSKQEEKSTQVISREQLILADTATRGSASASAYLVEFSDFQCPACKSFYPIVEEIIEKNKDDLLFAYRHYPLPQHPFAQKASLAAEAAKKQGKFWEMHKELFANQDKFSDQFFADLPTSLKLDGEKYKKSLDEQEVKSIIDKDKADGNLFGVDSTPTFFLNGKKLKLFTPQDLISAVEEAVKK